MANNTELTLLSIQKKLKENKLYLYFNVEVVYLPEIEQMLKSTNYHIEYCDKLFFTADLFLKRNN